MRPFGNPPETTIITYTRKMFKMNSLTFDNCTLKNAKTLICYAPNYNLGETFKKNP